MKILQVTNSFKYAWESGGVTKVAYEVSKNLVKRGHEVTVFATEKGLTGEANVKRNRPVIVDGTEAYYFSNLSDYLAKRALSIPYYEPFVAAKRIKEFDVIHIHELRRLVLPFIHHYIRKYNVPYVVQAHGSLPYGKNRRLKALYDNLWGRRLLQEAAAVIALTDTEAAQYEDMGVSRDRIKIVPNGVDLAEFEDLPSRGEFRKKYGLNGKDKIVLYLGRIHETKGIDILAKAFRALVQEMNDARLIIVGPDHGYLDALKKLLDELGIADRVLFTGPLYHREKLAAYIDSEVFVTPSFLGFPVTFVEACACGTPIITTAIGARIDWIDNQTGYVVDYNENQIKDAIAKILADRDLARRFGENGKRLVRERFNWQKITGEIERIYRGIVRAN